MKKDRSQSNSPAGSRGFVMLEPVLAGALLAIVTLVVVTALVAGRQSFASVAERTKALYLAQEGIEALRNIRDESIDAAVPGSWGLSRDGSTWTLEPDPDLTGEMFSRTITIASPAPDVREITSSVAWDAGYGERSVVLEARLTNWR